MTFFLGERPQSLEAFRASFRQATEDVANQGGRLAYVAHPARGSEVPCGPGGKVGGDWRAPKAVLVDTLEGVEALVEAERHGLETTSAARAWVLQQIPPRYLKVMCVHMYCVYIYRMYTSAYICASADLSRGTARSRTRIPTRTGGASRSRAGLFRFASSVSWTPTSRRAPLEYPHTRKERHRDTATHT